MKYLKQTRMKMSEKNNLIFEKDEKLDCKIRESKIKRLG